jgi:hypothetical protein
MQVQEGQGWRLLVDPARHPFVVLIGGAGWAAELTAQEAQTLRQAFGQLQQQHAAIADQLMDEESITLELDLGGLWMAIDGDRSSWQARFLLTPGDGQRALEGGWDAVASQALAAALAQHSEFKDWEPATVAAEKAVPT